MPHLPDQIQIVHTVHRFYDYLAGPPIFFPVLHQTGADIPVTGLAPLVIAAVDQHTAVLHLSVADAALMGQGPRVRPGHALFIRHAHDLIHKKRLLPDLPPPAGILPGIIIVRRRFVNLRLPAAVSAEFP